jgi:F-box protein 11
MSYARFNDVHDDGQVTAFRERLSAEVRVQTGEEFVIFQDRADIVWGQNWQRRIEQALDGVTLLLVIITPSFFRSKPCRDEVMRFAERERELGRDDLILPVYYVSTPELDDPARRDADPMAALLAARQFTDWRELRFEPLTSPAARTAIAMLGSRMRDAFWRPRGIRQGNASTGGPQVAAWLPTLEAGQVGSSRMTTRTEPPTYVVDAYQRGDFDTVSAAIKAAQPGHRILVRPGLYLESLVIDKPLEILGDGPVADIEIRARDADAVAFRANIGRIANLTLRQDGSDDQWVAVDITQGRLDLEGCDITSQGVCCVAIRSGADPRLRRNTIHDGKQAGIYIFDGGLGTLEDNDITANTSPGVAITTGGNPTLRRNTIHHNSHFGIFVGDGGLGTLEDNEITANTSSGVAIKTRGNPTLRRNTIHHNHSGVHIYDGGLGTLEDNDITANAYPGVAITTGGNPALRRNTIHDNKENGVYVYGEGLGTLEENDITANTSSGVAITTGGNPTLRRNTIHDNKNGIQVYDGGLGTLEDNDITANTNPGVAITTGGNPTLRGNRINRNGSNAVWIREGGGGVFEDNDLTGNKRGAWSIAADSKATVTRSGNRE